MKTLNDLGLGEKIPVAVLGATGSVGQRFVRLLAEHPWFDIRALMASDRSAGKTYAEATNWVQSAPLPAEIAALTVQQCEPRNDCSLAFSSLDSSVAGDIETRFAAAGILTVSNARNHRMDIDVPLLVPEVNPEHLDLAGRQQHSGAIITNPNCSTIGVVMALKPLFDAFGVEAFSVVTLQAVSGAGLPGVSSLQMLDNVLPLIDGEEEKIETESRKILGILGPDGIDPASMTISAACNRVAVIDGHTSCVSVRLRDPATADDVRDAWDQFRAEPQQLDLPSAPTLPLQYLSDPSAPQPRLHRDLGRGMSVSVGRLRPCPVLDFKFVALSHNTVRGAAGGAILAAELAVARGMLATDPG